MGVCLSKEEQLQCTQCKQPLIDLEKSTLLCDTMSNPACQMRRFSLETPRFSAEIGEMVGALIHKAIPKPFDSSLCGWTSETLLPSPDILRNCSSRRRPKKSFAFGSNRPSDRQKADEMSNAEKACREARINACTQDCCITGEENVSIKYNPMLGNRRIQRSNNELESDDASSDGSEDEIRIPVPTNSPERDWTAAISSPAFHHTPNCSHKSVEDGEEKNASDHYAIAHGTPETVLCKGHGRGESMWAMSAGEEFFTDWEMGGETGAAADKATRTRAASNEIAVFNAEDYFKDNAVEEITSTNAELNAGSCEYVATASASASCAENSEVALSSNLDSYRCDPCSEKPCCMQAEEVSLLGSTRSTLSASKSSQNSESTPRCRSKRQRCRQLIGSIKMLTTEAHQLFAINQSDHASRMPCFFNPRRSTSVSKSACKKAKRPAVKARINIAHAEESPHCKPFSQVDQRGEVMPVNQACDFFNFCKLAAGSDAGGADAFVTEPSHARLSALQKRVRFPATPSLSDAVHAFGSPLTVLRNSTDRETYEDGEDSDSSSDLFEIESLTTHLDSACPLSIKREEEEDEEAEKINISIPSLTKFAAESEFSLAHSKPLLESIKKTNVLNLSDRPLAMQLKETTTLKYQRRPRVGSLDCRTEDQKSEKVCTDARRSIPYAENEPPGPIRLLKAPQQMELLVEERPVSHSSGSGGRHVLGRLLKQTNDDTFYPNGLSYQKQLPHG